MTPLELLDALKAYIENETRDLLLPVRVDRKPDCGRWATNFPTRALIRNV